MSDVEVAVVIPSPCVAEEVVPRRCAVPSLEVSASQKWLGIFVGEGEVEFPDQGVVDADSDLAGEIQEAGW